MREMTRARSVEAERPGRHAIETTTNGKRNDIIEVEGGIENATTPDTARNPQIRNVEMILENTV